MASYADARAQSGLWLVRIEDLDRTREVAGAAKCILNTLKAFGLEWDAPPVRQRDRTDAYAAALAELDARTYPCGCTRAEIAALSRAGADGWVYPGTCRTGLPPGRRPRSMRLRTDGPAVRFRDRIQGEQSQIIAEATGDFVLRRADGLHAYQLAVVVDDAWQGVTHIVRGADLLSSTPRQILLQESLGLPRPSYAHIPLMLDEHGRKLSKSLASAPVDTADPLPAMRLAWQCLGQTPIEHAESPAAFWKQAVAHWRIDQVPRCASFAPPVA